MKKIILPQSLTVFINVFDMCSRLETTLFGWNKIQKNEIKCKCINWCPTTANNYSIIFVISSFHHLRFHSIITTCYY